jgi:tetratricopeptide (TPR) repeat protein
MTEGETHTPATADGAAGEAGEERWYLNDEHEFLRRSLADAETEHDAGDLSDADYGVLVGRDARRLAEVEQELGALPAAPSVSERSGPSDSPPGSEPPERVRPSEWRRIGIIACCFLIIAGVVILVVHAVTPRQPGQASSGSISLTKAQLIEQQLAQAKTANNASQTQNAFTLYQKVLSEDPNNPVALAGSGWIEWNLGTNAVSPTLTSAGRRAEQQAIRVSPSFWEGHLFLGLIEYNQDNNASGAVREFNQFLADAPPLAEVNAVASLLSPAYAKAGLPVPAALTTPSTTTTTAAPAG